jgi:hypothetical protein
MKATLAITSCLLALAAQLSAREFTDTQGRKLEGELLSVNGGQAVIKRSDGKAINADIKLFSGADQKFIADFAMSNVHYGFEVKYAKTKLGKTKKKDGDVTVEVEEWAYKLSLTNKSSGDLSGLRIDYWLFRRDDDGKNKLPPRVQASGSTTVEALRKGAVKDWQTTSFMLKKEQLQANFYYADGTRNTAKDSAGGVALRVFKGDKDVFSWATKDDLLALAQGPTGKAKDEDK